MSRQARFISSPVNSRRIKNLTISDFPQEELLGKGAFGEVWKVSYRSQDFALKQIPKSRSSRRQLLREIQILSELNHPYIVKLYHFFEDASNFYLLMQFAENKTLRNFLRKRRLLMEMEAAQVFRELLLAVECLHTHNPPLIHRDIKPENILLDSENRVLLADFGWSNFLTPNCPRKTVCGTLEYLPPEVIKEIPHGPPADVWTMGVVLYEMLEGTLPFTASERQQVVLSILQKEPEFSDDFPRLAKDLVLRMLDKDPDSRIRISEIKTHPWLDHVNLPPIRKFLRQDTLGSTMPTFEKLFTEESDSELCDDNEVFEKSLKVFSELSDCCSQKKIILENINMEKAKMNEIQKDIKSTLKAMLYSDLVEKNLEYIKDSQFKIIRKIDKVNLRISEKNKDIEELKDYYERERERILCMLSSNSNQNLMKENSLILKIHQHHQTRAELLHKIQECEKVSTGLQSGLQHAYQRYNVIAM